MEMDNSVEETVSKSKAERHRNKSRKCRETTHGTHSHRKDGNHRRRVDGSHRHRITGAGKAGNRHRMTGTEEQIFRDKIEIKAHMASNPITPATEANQTETRPSVMGSTKEQKTETPNQHNTATKKIKH